MIEIKKKDFKPLYDLACSDWKITFNNYLKESPFSEEIQFKEEFLEQMEKACTKEQLLVFKNVFQSWRKQNDLFIITTYSEVCKRLKEDEITEKDFKYLPSYMIKKLVAYARVKQLEKLFNEDFIKDWNNSNQYVYYPYFEFKKGSWGFYGVFDCSCGSYGWVGFFKDEKTANYVGKTFLKEIYEDILN